MKKRYQLLMLGTLLSLSFGVAQKANAEELESKNNVASTFSLKGLGVATKEIVALEHNESFTIRKNYFSEDKFTFRVRTVFGGNETFGLKYGNVINGKEYYNKELYYTHFNIGLLNYGLGKIVTGRGEQAFTITNYSNGVAFYEVGVNVTPWNYNSDFSF